MNNDVTSKIVEAGVLRQLDMPVQKYIQVSACSKDDSFGFLVTYEITHPKYALITEELEVLNYCTKNTIS